MHGIIVRCRRASWGVGYGVSGLVALLGCAASVGAQDHPLEATGVQPSRAYVRLLPWEQIDAYSGNLILTFTDLVLPGNAGFDVALTRTYNVKAPAGSHWTFTPGKVTHAEIQPNNLHNPRIVTGDSFRGELTFETAPGSGIFRTRTLWAYHRQTHVAYLPNGVTYTYDYLVGNERYLTQMRDAFGNTASFVYVQPDPNQPPRLDHLVQDLGNGQTRTVTFTYTASGQRETMSYLGRTWTYTWNENGALTAVTPPVGPGWTYGYDNLRLMAVTTPNGGTVEYLYDWQTVLGHQTLVLAARTASDSPERWWYFLYYGSHTVAVTRGTKETIYRFRNIAPLDDPGTLVRRETWHDAVLFEQEDLKWRASASLGEPDDSYEVVPGEPYAPLLVSSTITRGDRVFATAFLYHETDLNDYGQPWQITETGDVTRVTERTFRHTFPTFIRGTLATQTVTVAGQSFTRSFTYNDQGFLTTATTYGVVTTFAPNVFGNVGSATNADSHTTSYTYDWGVVKNTQTPEVLIERSINADGTVWPGSDAKDRRCHSVTMPWAG